MGFWQWIGAAELMGGFLIIRYSSMRPMLHYFAIVMIVQGYTDVHKAVI